MRTQITFGIIAALACIAVVVVAVSQRAEISNRQWYSGNFAVWSDYPHTIIIKDWSDFGYAQPGGGIVITGAEDSAFFPNLDRIPKKTVVTWEVEGDAVLHRQTIDLTGIVPPKTMGITIFELDAQMVWHVVFEPVADGISERLVKKAKEREAELTKLEAKSPPKFMRGRWFAGDFTVENLSTVAIEVKGWSNFDAVQPVTGLIGVQSNSSIALGKLSRMPEVTFVTWREQGTSAWKSQRIALKESVVPEAPGTVTFTLYADGEWGVSFRRSDL